MFHMGWNWNQPPIRCHLIACRQGVLVRDPDRLARGFGQ